MRSLVRTLLVLALIVAAGIGLVVWLGQGVGTPTGPGAATTASDAPSVGTTMTVTYVHDGDTLYLDPGTGGEELKVRLIGIDTPEIGDDAECFGDVARDRLRALLPEGTAVTVVAEDGPLDQYGRSLLHVYLPDGTHANRVLVDEGLAWAMFFDPNRDFEAEFRDAQRAAETAGAGMWGVCALEL